MEEDYGKYYHNLLLLLSVIIDEKARRRKWVKKHMVMCGYPAGIRI
ncbi:hypothetical protein CLOSCI_01997 [[Clostridium] scindens ATCC 35704]|jgi:hypothetical protein|nr:hypothetical protein CLOSCI_01997 [[Clostridium] scindens ATCC 35704]